MSISTCDTTMQVVPAGYNNGNGFFGGDGAWLLLFLLLGGRGFGGYGGGYGCGCGCSGYGGGYLPYEIQRGFDNQAVVTKLDGITQGLSTTTYELNNTLNNNFRNVDNAICQLGYNTQQGFNQTNIALLQGQNAISREISDCCCETKGAIKDVSYNIATVGCDIKNSIQNSTRDILENANANSRAVLEAINAQYVRTLERENNDLRLAASQTAQNAYLINQLKPCPQPAYITCNPFTGQYGGGYGCGSSCGCGC